MGENRLRHETSPYLLQHEGNPVHWWAWGEAAFAEARKTNKPVLLSIGYAACHWCHVMAHESFEDEKTAALMNELFINIKVDREERPDIDLIYQRAINMMGQQGGWPLTIFLDPGGEPFWGGTYFPNHPAHGRPSFQMVLNQISEVFRKNPDAVAKNRDALKEGLERAWKESGTEDMAPSVFFGAAELINQNIDGEAGGLAGAPKFPNMPLMTLLWNAGIRKKKNNYKLNFDKTLTMICQGGIYDHLCGGFCRYSVDPYWLVPHFEKMLYDNALLIEGLCEVYKETRNPLFEARVRETIGWLEREMMEPGGAFAASLDADSEGEEGKFYVWSAEEVEKALGKGAKTFMEFYGVTPAGNWEGKNILHRLSAAGAFDVETDAGVKECRQALLKVREQRPRPFLDDKILADWNGMMIAALVSASVTFERSAWLALARGAFDFIYKTLQVRGRLYHSWRSGKPGVKAYLDDYAQMTRAALKLYQATGDEVCLKAAEDWVGSAEKELGPNEAGFYLSPKQIPALIARPRTIHDQATPSGNAVMIETYAALYHLTGVEDYRDGAGALIRAFAKPARTSPFASGAYFSGYDAHRYGGHLFIKGDRGSKPVRALLSAAHGVSFPGLVIQVGDLSSHLPQAKGLKTGQAIVCQGTTCSLPIDKPAALKDLLLALREIKEE